MSTFLYQAEIAMLIGRKFKSRHIDSARRMAIPFFLNTTGASGSGTNS